MKSKRGPPSTRASAAAGGRQLYAVVNRLDREVDQQAQSQKGASFGSGAILDQLRASSP
jgi:hypothetical protein